MVFSALYDKISMAHNSNVLFQDDNTRQHVYISNLIVMEKGEEQTGIPKRTKFKYYKAPIFLKPFRA